MTDSFTIENPNPEDHLETEWLLTNGLGGYAMGTVLGVNTRRYHGLLVAATTPPVGRVVALHSMIEQLVIPKEDGSEEVIDLSTQMFVGPHGEPMLHPDGWKRLSEFNFSPNRYVAWTFDIPGGHVIKTLEIVGSCVAFNYYITNCPRVPLFRIRPIVVLRPFHTLGAIRVASVSQNDDRVSGVSLSWKDGGFDLRTESLSWVDEQQTWNGFDYAADAARGFPSIEDAWSPGYFLSDRGQIGGWRIWATYGKGKQSSIRTHRTDEPDLSRLHQAARCFVVLRGSPQYQSQNSIIAGYPWFADWGRDAMISLPGLLLCTKRFDEARSVLETFASNMRGGLIPNRFDDNQGEAHYNTVDASLWFVYAVWQYARVIDGTGVPPVPPDLLNSCRDIICAYREGTDFGIHMDPADGLITAGDESTQLTWMDAARDGHIFTPRHGKPVEVNALWYNALLCAADMTEDNCEVNEMRKLAERVAESFLAKFWWDEKQCLYDVLTRQSNGKLRPNQIFAVSLPHSPLTRDQQRAVVEFVRERFLTAYGLRTLDRDDPDYCLRYEGDMWSRDKAYHNGTVWPWLIGPYCEAVMRVNDFSDESKRAARECLQPLLDEMARTSGHTMLGQIAEVYDGDSPHTPDGCPAQAWSIAEVLRILDMVEH